MTAPLPAPEPGTRRLPAFVNPHAGSADAARKAIGAAPAFVLHEVEPAELADTLRHAVEAGAPRVLVSGGDGSLATAASALAGTRTELAILPGGTLNHFAKYLGVPEKPDEALALAEAGDASPVDIGFLGDRAFINTSSIGAYVRFVQLREAMEPRLGYYGASVVAALRTLARMRSFSVSVTVEGVQRTYRTPVVFVGVGERELRVPILGGRVTPERSGLHVMIVRGGPVRRLLALVMLVLTRGVRAASASPWLDAFLVDECRIATRHHHLHVSLDGELVPMAPPLEYRLGRGALLVVRPQKGAT